MVVEAYQGLQRMLVGTIPPILHNLLCRQIGCVTSVHLWVGFGIPIKSVKFDRAQGSVVASLAQYEIDRVEPPSERTATRSYEYDKVPRNLTGVSPRPRVPHRLRRRMLGQDFQRKRSPLLSGVA
jgi:hypothetical protein